MKAVKVLAIFAAMLLGAATSASALARGGHGYGHGGHGYRGHSHFGVGVYLGGPIYAPWSPWYYPAPYYYPPAVVAVPSSPPVYIEQGGDYQAAPAPQSQNYWYYCADSKTYYPYVNECPGGWQRVSPQPQ